VRQEIQRTIDDLERQRLSTPDQPKPGERFSLHPGPDDLKDKMLTVGPETAKLLKMLIRAMQARSVLGIDGSMGCSTIWMGEAVEANGGRLMTMEHLAQCS